MNVQVITDNEFDAKVIKASKPVLIDFWAQWCGPCRQLSPIIEDIAKDMSSKVDFYKIDVDANPEISVKFGIMSIPTLLIFKNGKMLANKVGAGSKKVIVDWIEDHVS